MRMMYSSMDIHLRPPTEAAGILGRPGSGDDVVSYLGMNLFGTPADELVERLSEDARTEVSEGGRSVTAPDLLLALWRAAIPESPAEDDGRYFESVLVARPGYYD
jgi:hypothetical protein